jgi:hypothetical protein
MSSLCGVCLLCPAHLYTQIVAVTFYSCHCTQQELCAVLASPVSNLLRHEINSNNFQKFTSLIAENVITNTILLMLFKQIIAVYSEKHMKPVNTSGQIAEFI